MQNRLRICALFAMVLIYFPGPLVFAQESNSKMKAEWYGYMGGDFRYFHDPALYEGQKETYFSAVFKPQMFIESRNGRHQFHFMGFARLDQYDDKRTHADIRDLYWRFAPGTWEINAGVKTVTWGKTESNHLVDIVNQYDLVEGRTLEHKLGQPLIQFTYAPSWATLELYVMTFNRNLQFPGKQGRLQPGFPIDDDHPEYEKDGAQYRPDYAIRLARSTGNFDFALSNFYGTNRLPLFKLNDLDTFVPLYEEINQTGFEFHWLTGPFAWKLEAINQYSERQTIRAFTVGGEYNIYFRSGPELKWMLEYTYDERDREQISGINNDLFIGLNLNFNDRQSTHLMLIGFYDLDYGTTIIRTQVERRFGDSWKANLVYNGITNTDPQDFYHLIRNDSFIELGLFYYFQK